MFRCCAVTLVSFGACALLGRTCQLNFTATPEAIINYTRSTGELVALDSIQTMTSLSVSSQASAVVIGAGLVV